MNDSIIIKGARQHNLKNVDLTIPRDKLIVFTGLSGSGKSSLAFDTIYAEGQRRYVESLSSYARQFLGQLDKMCIRDRAYTIGRSSNGMQPQTGEQSFALWLNLSGFLVQYCTEDTTIRRRI